MAPRKKTKATKKIETNKKKQVFKIPEKKYNRIELAKIFGVSAYEMRTYYSLAGIPIEAELTITEARRLFKSI